MTPNDSGMRAERLPPPPNGYGERMPRHEEATLLRVVGRDASGRPVRLEKGAAEAWEAMRAAAERGGVRLLLLSGFRSVGRQTEIIEGKMRLGVGWEDILKVSAYPGHSEHHTGRAVDLGSPDCPHLSEAFESTGEFGWLVAHAGAFGFTLSYPRSNRHGIAYEPWHWCWRGDRSVC